MDWLTTNWDIVLKFIQAGKYFDALINPLGIAISLMPVVLSVPIARMRKFLCLTTFLLWSFIPLYHYTMEGTKVEAGSSGGFGSVGIFAAGCFLILGILVYFLMIKE